MRRFSIGSPSERSIYDRLSLAHDRVEMRLVLEALRVDLVDVLGARRSRRKPAGARDDLQPADRRGVARGAGELGRDRLAGQLRGLDGLRGELPEPRLFGGRRRSIDALQAEKSSWLGVPRRDCRM